MGTLYETQPKLQRTVAIKVLPEHVASDPELKQRFQREAKTLASLDGSQSMPPATSSAALARSNGRRW